MTRTDQDAREFGQRFADVLHKGIQAGFSPHQVVTAAVAAAVHILAAESGDEALVAYLRDLANTVEHEVVTAQHARH